MAIQNDHLRRQIEALSSLPPTRRKKFQLICWRCRSCGDVVLEGLDTRPYPVIRFRRVEDRVEDRERLPEAGDLDGWIAWTQSKKRPLRVDDWKFFPFPWPMDDGQRTKTSRELVRSACACRQHNLGKFSRIVDDLLSGTTERTV